jgi:hypothetical protein
VNFVRATYWLGAIVDALAGVQLLLPRGTSLLGFPGLRPGGAAGQPAVVAAVLMFGFAAVLIWAHLRTVERRTVLAITLAVVLGLAAGNVVLAVTAALTWADVAPTLVIQAILATMFAVSHALATRKAARQ